jgi:CheY-like chemotaxis protein
MTFQAAKRALVLIVEDELLIRLDAVDMIEAAGFDVVQAGNADEAITILEARSDIQLVFTDIQMPGSMDGLKLRSSRPRVIMQFATVSCRKAASFFRSRITPQSLARCSTK